MTTFPSFPLSEDKIRYEGYMILYLILSSLIGKLLTLTLGRGFYIFKEKVLRSAKYFKIRKAFHVVNQYKLWG